MGERRYQTRWISVSLFSLTLISGQVSAQSAQDLRATNAPTISESREIDWFVPEVNVVAFSLKIVNPETGDSVLINGIGGGVGASIPINHNLSGYMRFTQNLSPADQLAGVSVKTAFGVTAVLTGSSLRRRDTVTTSSGTRVDVQSLRSGGIRMDFGIFSETVMTSTPRTLSGGETCLRWETQFGRLGLFGLGAALGIGRSPFLRTEAISIVATWSGT